MIFKMLLLVADGEGVLRLVGADEKPDLWLSLQI